MNPLHRLASDASTRSRILDLWDEGKDTFDIALILFGDRRREAEVYNTIARLSGETESCQSRRRHA
jgi:hypothetical protein